MSELKNPIYTFRGKVKTGAKRGRLLGYPTANIALHQKIPEGIWASEIAIDGKTYQAATFIGTAKTFGEKDYKAESFILDFLKEIYGSWATVKLYKKIRDNVKFATEQELTAQMRQDELNVRDFFRSL